MALMSNMLVGSSSSRRSGLEKSARASASLILHPPENSLVFLCCISVVKPNPFNMTLALAGALSASIFCSCIYTSLNSVLRSGLVFLENIRYSLTLSFVDFEISKLPAVNSKHRVYHILCSIFRHRAYRGSRHVTLPSFPTTANPHAGFSPRISQIFEWVKNISLGWIKLS